ncbi:helicase HerA-like domain-containing protein [Inquilinus sp. YAF38]|uniref:helicase HerA-like domain-containing protein n=1 Tax=Inquilinus sp. YAF38 TaxID=3233084 RepID=UPI003F8DF410
MTDGLTFAKGQREHRLLLGLGNRHGLIAGATGTGKTVSLKVLAEGFSQAGVPVFVADVKGDIAGISQPGAANPKIEERAKTLGLGALTYQGYPTVFWDLYGKLGTPVRATVAEMGPLLLSRLLQLNDTQEGVLNIAFKAADEEGLLLLDLKDLQALLAHMAENASKFTGVYGNVSKASVGSIQRQLLVLEQQGAEAFFGEPALDLMDLIRTGSDGRGMINVLAAETLIQAPRLYATFLLWLLSELFERLPEVGDPDKPKLVFFFDEAHLLFDDAPKALVEKVEQVVRLIRSKGVGVYFVSQNPIDIPDKVLAQLGNRAQHALRAFTPRDQKALKASADTFRTEAGLDVARALQELAVGEALVSFLDAKGIPEVVERALVCPPVSRLGPITDGERQAVIAAGGMAVKYAAAIDRDSAYEKLSIKAAEAQQQATAAAEAKAQAKAEAKEGPSMAESIFRDVIRNAGSSVGTQLGRSLGRSVGGSGAGTIGGSIGRAVVRGVLGSLFGGRR